MKKVIFLFAIIYFLLCLAACGKDASVPGLSTTPTATEPSSPSAPSDPSVPTGPSAPTPTVPTEPSEPADPTDPADPSDPPDPPEPPTKIVYVHSSLTQEVGSTVSRTEYLFDGEDRVAEVVVYTNNVETKRHSVQCDEHGNYIRWISDSSVMEYAYDGEGHSLGMTMYVDGKLVSSTTYTWENGLRTSATTQTSAQNMTQKVLMTYNASGHLLRQDSYTADELTSYSAYTTDAAGIIQFMTTYHPDGKLHSRSTYRWENRTQIITVTDAAGAMIQIDASTYDEHGNLLSREVYDAGNNLISKETHTWRAVRVPLDCPRASV